MGIYIKGMEMPRSCVECPVNMELCKRGYKYFLEHEELYGERAKDCPIIEVPPHGDLIDRDELEYHADNVRDPMGRTEKTVMWKIIEAAPTILPADPAGEATT